MFIWDVLKHRVPKSVRFCIGDLPMFIFFILYNLTCIRTIMMISIFIRDSNISKIFTP